MTTGIVDTVRVNNSTFGWSSCLFQVDGIGTEGIVAIDYEEQLEVRPVYSNQSDGPALGLSQGRYSVGRFPIRMLRDSAVAFKTYLQAQAAASPSGLPPSPSGSYGQAVFTLTMQLIAVDSPTGLPSTVVFADCRVVGEKAAHEEGIDEAVTEFQLGCLAIVQDGTTLWNALPAIVGGFPVADTISIGPVTMPGKWTLLKGDKEYGWQIRQASAMTGATVVPIGDPLIESEFQVEFWDPADYQAFRLARSTYLKKPIMGVPGAPASLALSIDHPELKEMGCKDVVVKKITPVLNDGYGVWSCKVIFLQYRKPKPALSKPDATIPDTGMPRPTAQDAQDQELLQLSAEQQALAGTGS